VESQKAAAAGIAINGKNLIPSEVADLFFNGVYFHNDAGKQAVIAQLNPQ